MHQVYKCMPLLSQMQMFWRGSLPFPRSWQNITIFCPSPFCRALKTLRQSSEVTQSLFQPYIQSCFCLSLSNSASNFFSSLARLSNSRFISQRGRSECRPPTHLITFFCSFQTQLMPSRTFVMSQMRRFCTFRSTSAVFKSTVPCGLFLSNSVNLRVRRERPLSCRPEGFCYESDESETFFQCDLPVIFLPIRINADRLICQIQDSLVKITMSVNKNLSARRKEKDIFKLRSADYKVEQSNESESTYSVEFIGPPNTPYARGKWQINLYLPEDYPYKSPSVGFGNKIYHPNIDFDSGSVCLDVINQTWTPMYELVNVFQIFLPQLLTYPNPASPLNHEAAQLYERNPKEYHRKVNDLIDKHAFTQQEVPIQIEIPHIVPDPPQSLVAEQTQMIDQTCSLSDHDSLHGNDELGMY